MWDQKVEKGDVFAIDKHVYFTYILLAERP